MDIPSRFKIILQQCATEAWYRKACEMCAIGPDRTYDLRRLERLWQELRGGRSLRARDLGRVNTKP